LFIIHPKYSLSVYCINVPYWKIKNNSKKKNLVDEGKGKIVGNDPANGAMHGGIIIEEKL